jgi:hypothetical protein
MKLEDHIKILQSVAIKHTWLYTKMILQLAREHLTESGFLINPNENATRLTIEEFLKLICLRGVKP